MNKIDAILEFWFQGLNDNDHLTEKKSITSCWFVKDAAFDQEIKEKFEKDILSAKEGKYMSWEEGARGRLALIILYDQFTRNIYRATAKMHETDLLALNLTLQSISDGKDRELQFIERVFLYMPLMHSEDIERQEQSAEVFNKLVEESKEACPQNTAYFNSNLDYAIKHLDVVKVYNRFPHRNKMLSRESTPEEVEFLQKPGSSF